VACIFQKVSAPARATTLTLPSSRIPKVSAPVVNDLCRLGVYNMLSYFLLSLDARAVVFHNYVQLIAVNLALGVLAVIVYDGVTHLREHHSLWAVATANAAGGALGAAVGVYTSVALLGK